MFSTSIFSLQVLVMWWSALPLLVATTIGTVRFRVLPSELRYLVGLTWWMVAAEVVSRLLWFHHLPNLFLKPLYAVGECALLVLMYAQAIQRPVVSRRLYILLIILTGYILLDTLVLEKVAWFRPGQEVVKLLVILLLVGLYFKKLLDELKVHRLDLDSMFWVSVGLIFYCMGSVLIQLFSNYALQHTSKSFNLSIWAFHALLLAFLASCYGAALYLYKRHRKEPYFLDSVKSSFTTN
jgi:hypothetical protein